MTGQPPISILNTIRHSADHTDNSDLTVMSYRMRCISQAILRNSETSPRPRRSWQPSEIHQHSLLNKLHRIAASRHRLARRSQSAKASESNHSRPRSRRCPLLGQSAQSGRFHATRAQRPDAATLRHPRRIA